MFLKDENFKLQNLIEGLDCYDNIDSHNRMVSYHYNSAVGNIPLYQQQILSNLKKLEKMEKFLELFQKQIPHFN